MKYPEAAHAFAEQLLSDEDMSGLPQALGIGVTTDVKLPEEIQMSLVYNSPERVALKKEVDWQKWMADRSARIERGQQNNSKLARCLLPHVPPSRVFRRGV
ncbi:hypothetical protein LMTR13_25885 [Bradyrhizobium icense]|uniref:Uncharacterized protein n=1 Tax=Bradyrhizobium icense TaxID=1274631 RepID=A0A1B1UJV6_9BRAD|nr:hypothetical protein LMTR13_25885 [Bradyrhizobium icense]